MAVGVGVGVGVPYGQCTCHKTCQRSNSNALVAAAAAAAAWDALCVAKSKLNCLQQRSTNCNLFARLHFVLFATGEITAITLMLPQQQEQEQEQP